jgi:hypothetical protein
MKISPSEAQSALADIRAADQQMQQSLNSWGAAYHFLVWGGVCLIGFSITQFHSLFPDAFLAGSWVVLNLIGMLGSWIIALRMRHKFHFSVGPRIAILWPLFVLFGVLEAFFVHPNDGREITMMIMIFNMLWMAVLGLWVNNILLWAALILTGFSLFGYVVFPDYFYLWMAFLIGGTLIGSGLYILRSGR